ncbi:hypothetical protein GNI_115130 [Gregarina niphandrodes]|uniref:Uncharacterized protein n=1 Tax=Gregarina niphandrodes TaxID=110365 RepID=A0A023B326_GRENI|nr:hypothetical protein GNI_115130 [Gregarina niphandrodes]EZG55284.1 hypothetical protein GNI_115130 [Gregarina niphandrodes]|eukprot:XP_011131663.1 hypothetical protein GNI_115130 [Gregarina niphandrodes]
MGLTSFGGTSLGGGASLGGGSLGGGASLGEYTPVGSPATGSVGGGLTSVGSAMTSVGGAMISIGGALNGHSGMATGARTATGRATTGMTTTGGLTTTTTTTGSVTGRTATGRTTMTSGHSALSGAGAFGGSDARVEQGRVGLWHTAPLRQTSVRDLINKFEEKGVLVPQQSFGPPTITSNAQERLRVNLCRDHTTNPKGSISIALDPDATVDLRTINVNGEHLMFFQSGSSNVGYRIRIHPIGFNKPGSAGADLASEDDTAKSEASTTPSDISADAHFLED